VIAGHQEWRATVGIEHLDRRRIAGAEQIAQ
jgi:hypothetical protein